jgi:predicted ATPase
MLSTQYISRITLMRDKAPSFDVYPFSLPAVRALDVLEPHAKVTFLVGENGSGRSTPLEAIAVSTGFNPEGGKEFSFRHARVAFAAALFEGERRVRPADAAGGTQPCRVNPEPE